jgi:hypothetical protein
VIVGSSIGLVHSVAVRRQAAQLLSGLRMRLPRDSPRRWPYNSVGQRSRRLRGQSTRPCKASRTLRA